MQRLMIGGVCAVIVGLLAVISALAQERRPDSSELRLEERLDQTVRLRTKDGQVKDLHVVIRNWGLRGALRVQEFPEQGFMIVHLRAGRVITVVDGKREERRTGDFWTVPAGSRMSVEVTGESAVLQTMAVR